jgi:hypothetical protein
MTDESTIATHEDAVRRVTLRDARQATITHVYADKRFIATDVQSTAQHAAVQQHDNFSQTHAATLSHDRRDRQRDAIETRTHTHKHNATHRTQRRYATHRIATARYVAIPSHRDAQQHAIDTTQRTHRIADAIATHRDATHRHRRPSIARTPSASRIASHRVTRSAFYRHQYSRETQTDKIARTVKHYRDGDADSIATDNSTCMAATDRQHVVTQHCDVTRRTHAAIARIRRSYRDARVTVRDRRAHCCMAGDRRMTHA